MLRAMWTGSISFGLVAIPVKAIPAQSSKDLRFELLHEKCCGKLQTRRYCPRCEREVPEDEVVRGFQYRKGDYVVFEPKELEGVATPAKHSLHILDFVNMADIDPVYFEKPYYLQPAPGGERTYALLREAMSRKGRVGIGKVAFRDREHLAVIRPLEHALVLETIAFPDEVRALEDAVPSIEARVDDRELQMADMLIESLTTSFQPEKYRDEYRDALTEMVESKVGGGAVRPAAPAPPTKGGQVTDLMEVLRRSVEAAQGGRGEAAPVPEPRRKVKATARRPREKQAA